MMIKYIEEVRLKNFQSHIDTKIELDPELNIIVGESDSGKTSILRAIKWVLYNEPLGDFFIRQGETESSVTVIFNDKVQVTRYRSPSKNQYILLLADGSKEIYEGFGTGVPQEIIDATGIDRLELDQNESRTINLGEQLEGAFLLSEKDSVKASSIGRLVGVNIIDDALRQSLTDLRGLNQEKNRLIETEDKLRNEYKEFDYLVDLEKRLDTSKLLLANIKKLTENEKQLTQIYLKNKNIKKQNIVVEKTLESLKNTEKIEKYINNIALYLMKYNNLNKIDKNLKRIKMELKKEIEKKEKLKDVKTVSELEKSLSNDIDNYVRFNKVYERLINLNKSIKKTSSKLELVKEVDKANELNNDLIKLTARYRTLENIYNKLDDTQKRFNFGEKYIAKFEKIEDINHDKILELNSRLVKLNKSKNKLIKLMDLKKKSTMNLMKINNDIKELLEIYRNTLNKQDICPLCLSVIDEEHIEVIINDYMGDMKI